MPAAKDFRYTAIVKCERAERMYAAAGDAFGDANEDHKAFKMAVESTLQSYFRKRRADQAEPAIVQWVKEGVYPYKDEPSSPVNDVRREVFDACALTIHELMPKFEETPRDQKKLTLQLLRQAIETDTGSLSKILTEVLRLSPEHRDQLAGILESTQLSSVVKATKTVLDRLTFIDSTEPLVFGDKADALLERDHLQKVVKLNLWLFGEQFSFGVEEVHLREALRIHAEKNGLAFDPATSEIYNKVDGKLSRLDLLLSNTYKRTEPFQHEYLVVELKRSTVVLGQKEVTQIKNYAHTVRTDARFSKNNTKWTWVLVGRECTDDVEYERCQDGYPAGLLLSRDKGQFQVWVRTWGEIVTEARLRYQFFMDSLNAQITQEQSLNHLLENYSAALPEVAGGTAKPRKKSRPKSNRPKR